MTQTSLQGKCLRLPHSSGMAFRYLSEQVAPTSGLFLPSGDFGEGRRACGEGPRGLRGGSDPETQKQKGPVGRGAQTLVTCVSGDPACLCPPGPQQPAKAPRSPVKPARSPLFPSPDWSEPYGWKTKISKPNRASAIFFLRDPLAEAANRNYKTV